MRRRLTATVTAEPRPCSRCLRMVWWRFRLGTGHKLCRGCVGREGRRLGGRDYQNALRKESTR